MSSGIYMIRSMRAPDRAYVGSAKKINQRWWDHRKLLRKGRHFSTFMQNHFNRHGEGDLEFLVLCECQIGDLLFYEQRFLDGLRPAFNTLKVAGSSLGLKHSEKTCKKISLLKKGNKNYLHKKPTTEETRAKMREAALKRKGKASAETRAKISAALRARPYRPRRPHNRISPSPETRAKIAASLRRRAVGPSHGDLFDAAGLESA